MLPKRNRLPATEIPVVFHRGKRVRGRDMDLVYTKAATGKRYAVVISTKIDKRAVVRHRLKRLVNESIQRILKTLPDMDGIFVVHATLPDSLPVVQKMTQELLDHT